jgi:DNA polymerase-1
VKTLYIIDVSGFIFRAFYGLPPSLSREGKPINAVLGFCQMLLKIRQRILERTEDIALWCGAFDVARKNFRHELSPSYKAHRRKTPEDLVPQFPLIRDACQVFGCPICEKEGFEADDIIATYTALALQKGLDVVIMSSDKDLMQLSQEGVLLFDPMKEKWIQKEDIVEKFGVSPTQITEVQALAGDQSDGITGAPGMGVKTAAELIRQFGNLETLLKNASCLPQKRRDMILKNIESILLSKTLATLKQDIPLNFEEETMTFPRVFSSDHLRNINLFCDKHGFVALKKKLAFFPNV